MRKFLLSILILSLMSVPAVFAQDSDLPTIAELAQGDENLSNLVEVLTEAELIETFNGEGEFTVFAPTNAAFESLPPGMLDGIMSSPPSREAVFKFHVLEGTFTAEDLAAMAGESIPSLAGIPLNISVNDDGSVVLNASATVVSADLPASNGIVHVIDAVLVPQRPGSSSEEPAAGNTIRDIVASRDDLAFLDTALSLSESIGNALGGESKFTLLAPNSDAFNALDADTRNAAIADPNLLGSILLYHVVEMDEAIPVEEMIGILQASDEPYEVETLLPGATLSLTVDEEGNLLINDAKVVEFNIEADNGWIQIIDTVLAPPEDTILEDVDAYLAEMMGEATNADETTGIAEGPALDPNWEPVMGGFGMDELDTADDFFITVVDPFTDEELYGVQIINWVAEYEYTGYIIEQFLPAEVLLWMGEQDHTIWQNISPVVLEKLPDAEFAKLPESVQALAPR